jgi:hypothetical protein
MANYGLDSVEDLKNNEALMESHRYTVLKYWPNGRAKLTALTAIMKDRGSFGSWEHGWWVEGLATQQGAVTGVYTDSALSNAYTTGGVKTDRLFIKMGAVTAQEFRAGHTGMINVSISAGYQMNVYVTSAPVIDGVNSYLPVALLMDDTAVGGKDLSDADYIRVIGSAHSHGAPAPRSITYHPTRYTNYPEIFRTSLRLTSNMLNADTKYGKKEYQRQKKQKLELHSIELEKAMMFGNKSSSTDPETGQPIQLMDGMWPFARAYAPADHIRDFHADCPTGIWLDDGLGWFNDCQKTMFDHGNPERMGFCGGGAAQGIDMLALTYGNLNLTPNDKLFGIQLTEYKTTHGILGFSSHPLYKGPVLDNAILIFYPGNLGWKPYNNLDTHFRASPPKKSNEGESGIDGILEEWYTQGTLELGIPMEYMILLNVGVDAP